MVIELNLVYEQKFVYF